jgi:hypothetical protein
MAPNTAKEIGLVLKIPSTVPQRAPAPFPGSAAYWEQRYSSGGNSGVGSYGAFAEFKAEVLNDFVAKNAVKTVIEFGCGDGNQLSLSRYPDYLGVDVSPTVLQHCKERFKSDMHKTFCLLEDYRGEQAQLSLSLDVIYHLVEDNTFDRYMRTLFDAATEHVIIYASDTDDNLRHDGEHIRHRKFTAWISQNLPGWKLAEHLPNRYPYRGDYRRGSFAEFFIFAKSI